MGPEGLARSCAALPVFDHRVSVAPAWSLSPQSLLATKVNLNSKEFFWPSFTKFSGNWLPFVKFSDEACKRESDFVNHSVLTFKKRNSAGLSPVFWSR